MKTLTILTALMLTFSACHKTMPVPNDGYYYYDDGSYDDGSDDQDSPPADDGSTDDGSDEDDPGYDGNSSGRHITHTAHGHSVVNPAVKQTVQ